MVFGVSAINPFTSSINVQYRSSGIKIIKVDSNFEREPFISPYRFNSGRISEVCQTVCYLETDSGLVGIGLGTQGVLWSDSKVFFDHSENGGNAIRPE